MYSTVCNTDINNQVEMLSAGYDIKHVNFDIVGQSKLR